MSSPLLFGAVLGGAYLFYKKVLGQAGKSAPGDKGAQVTQNGITFQATVLGSDGAGGSIVDIFTLDGSRILRYVQTGTGATRRRVETVSPPGVDPAIRAAALKAYAVTPKA
jgi:hypothetical protein